VAAAAGVAAATQGISIPAPTPAASTLARRGIQ
jgi:hypothetical protein